ncbi:MAG: thiamine-monophosphate kinase [Promethearchaeota archaeon]
MNNNLQIGNLGETKLIDIIEKLIFEKTGKVLLRDDSFFADISHRNNKAKLVINTDMLVSTSDVPNFMNFFQIGRKSIIMNISDIVVKGVKPTSIIISLGLPKNLKTQEFTDLLNGIIECSLEYEMDYIGGDINESQELIINPTVFGFKNPLAIIYRRGVQVGDILVANNKFGLTGVGFDILINQKGNPKQYMEYQNSIKSVLEPEISGKEAQILSDRALATASIDSSDGLYKSLEDLIISNPNLGFEIDFNSNLIANEAVKYSKEFNKSIEDLVLNGGEEFIHIFTINPKNIDNAQKVIESNNGNIFEIGRAISEKGIFISKEGVRKQIKNYGFEHFREKA